MGFDSPVVGFGPYPRKRAKRQRKNKRKKEKGRMALVARAAARPLRQLPRTPLPSPSSLPFLCFRLIYTKNFISHHLPSFTFPLYRRNLHLRSRGLRKPDSLTTNPKDKQSDAEVDSKKSRNDMKREARRAVQWGMDLASFSTPQIKRIIKAAALEPEVFEALMLAKRLGPDVREGKRRQYNYIGKLLRDAEPHLLDGLIQATKDGDQSMIQALCDSKDLAGKDDEEDEVYASEPESEGKEDDQESQPYIALASKWYDGLINRDIEMSNEVYSIHVIEFDRQELRKLVRKVHSIQERKGSVEDENEEKLSSELAAAESSLARFLRSLAKQISTEQDLIA